MLPRGVGARRGLRWGPISLLAAVSIVALTSDPSHARSHRKHFNDAEATSSDVPRYADIVVDGNTGAILHAQNPDAPRHPASLTKVMTLYLLFEQLEAGKLRLDTPLEVSEHASVQSPTKLGLREGQTIKVEDAIKGIVTRSANDAAVVIAERIGGDEETFARLMTHKAQTLGMAHTLYRNASGLPNDEQVSTARDQALLGRAIQERFPAYYKYFSTRSFEFHGETIGNHNHLLGTVDGVDGIKTGYVNASGFNILTSVHRSGRYLVAVVFGGSSASSRDERMRELISEHIAEASTQHSATLVADARAETRPEARAAAKPEPKAGPKSEAKAEPKAKAETRSVSQTYEMASASSVPVTLSSRSDPGAITTFQVPHEPVLHAAAAIGSADPIHPVPVRTVTVHAGGLTQTASLNQVAIPAPAEPAPPAPPEAAAPPAPPTLQPPTHAEIPFPPPIARAGILGTLPVRTVTATGSLFNTGTPPAAAAPVSQAPAAATPVAAPAPVIVATAAPVPVIAPPPAPAAATPPQAHSGWMIQVGAFPAEAEAKLRLSNVQSRAARYLASADPFTETVSKGDTVWYRARFAGLAKEQAEAACSYLKRNDVDCMTIKN